MGNSTISYNYQDLFSQMNITEFSKQDVINIRSNSGLWNFYFNLFLMLLLYSLINYILSILWNAVIISIFGYFATWISKIKMRYAAIFNMSIYALTLSVILNTLYIAVNIFVDFDIKYFQVMYVTVASIYLIAAIFIIKSDFIKKQIELAKIVQMQQKIKEENEKQEENEEENQPEKKDKEPNDKEDEKQDENKKGKQDGETPEGSQA